MALASWDGSALRLMDVALGSVRRPPSEVISTWLQGETDALLALDAPLGWPISMGEKLSKHHAGQPIDSEPDHLFRRQTDRRIKERLGKMPLEVGANLIARTAHGALRLLEEIRKRTGHPVRLVWEPSSFSGIGAIEVYPAATQIACKVPKDLRVDGLWTHLRGDLSKVGTSKHIRDAAWCAVAGADFLANSAESPSDIDLAEREGWIWVRS